MPQVGAFIVGAFGWGTGAALTGAAATAYVAGTAFAGTVIGGLTVKLLTSVAITALQAALMSDPAQGGGITISTTLRGEDNPETIILGRYATAGHCVYVNSHGRSRRWLTHVVEVCSAPGATLNRLMLGDQWVTLAEAPMPGYEQYGLPVTSEDYEGGYVFVKYYDGSQTTADPMLVDKYGADPDRPWASTAIGAGLCYAVLTFYHHAEILPQIPPYRFELDGIPLYDIRKDSTRGGSGPQRMDDPSTWVQTDNAAVIVWNVLKGVPLPGGEIWGGGFDVSFMPTSVSTLAMNRCDVPVALSEGTEPTYRAAFEAALTQEPAATVTELLKACSGTIADMGYAWTMAVGAPALPVYAVSDDDLIVSKSQTLDPFPSLADTYNAVSVRYPSPEHLWESHEAPLRTDAAAEASDVFGRRTASLTLPAAPYGDQVQRLSLAWLNDNRRFIRHIVNVPPDAAALDMVDSLDWTSDRNGYVDKTFSLYEIAEDLRTCGRQFSIRERNADDYNWTSSAELPSPPTTTATPQVAEGVAGFDATASSVVDADGVARRAAIEITWDSEIAAQGIRWEIRLDGQTTVRLYGDTQEVSDGIEVLTSGILPDTAYEIRARLIAERKTAWTAWFPVTTQDVRVGTADLADPVRGSLNAGAAAALQAAAVRADHDALVAGFTGTLAAAFDQTEGNIDKLRQTVEVTSSDAIFRDTFDGDLSDWEVLTGAGEVVAVASTEGIGGKILRLGNNSGADECWVAHKHLIPFDPTKTYKSTVRMRTGAGVTGRPAYVGFLGIAADGVTIVNTGGVAGFYGSHYHVVAGWSPTSEFFDYVGYSRGRAASGMYQGSEAAPATVHQDVAYLRPMIVANNGATGITEIAHFTVLDAVAADLAAKVETQQVALVTATNAIAGLQTSLTAEVTRSSLQADDPILAQGLSRWSYTYVGVPEAMPDASFNLTTQPSTDPMVGGLDFVSSAQSGLYSKKIYQIRPDRKYRIRARAKRVSGSTGYLYLGHVCLNADGSAAVGHNGGHKYSAAGGLDVSAFPVGDFVEFTAIVSGVDEWVLDKFNAGTESIRLVALLGYGETTIGASVMALSYFGIEDITEAAQVSAALTTLQGTTASADAALASSITNLSATVQGGLEAAATNWVAQPTVETGTLTGWDAAVIANAPAGHPVGRTKAIRSNITRHCYAAFPSGSYTRYANLAGRRIRVSGYVYVPAGKGTVYAGAFTYLNGVASYPLATIVGPATARDTWVKFSGEFVCGESSSVKMSIWQDEVGGLYDLYLTDVRYEDITEVAQVTATLTQQASAIAKLDGFASASYVLGMTAGGAAAGLSIMVADGFGGIEPVSDITLDSKHINLKGKVRASDLTVAASTTAISPDPGINDPAIWAYASYTAPTIVDVTDGPVSKKALRGLANVNSHFACREFSINPAKKYKFSGWYQRSAADTPGGNCYLRVYWYGQDLNYLDYTEGQVFPTTTWQQMVQANLTPPANARFARLYAIPNYGGTGGYHDVQGLLMEEMVDGSVVVEGSLNADDIKAGVLESRFLKITELLKIDSGTGAFSVGKNSAYDLANDGVYFGRTLEPNGTAGFGLMAGKRVSGVDQYIQATSQSGLRLVNADFFVTAAAAPVTNDVATSQTITLPVGSVTLDLTLQAAGGGGMAGNGVGGTGSITPSTAGGNVTVQLWDGTTYTGVSWAATGGPAQALQHTNPSGWNGESSPLGVGGVVVAAGQGQSGGNGTGYGAGGGGGTGGSNRSGGNGGYAGQHIIVDRYSLVGIANPKLVITIGSPGLGALRQPGSNAGPKGGDGAPGLVRYATRSATEARASVLPIVPTFTGTISKASGGALVFPPLGAGLWQLSAVGGNLLLDTVETHMNGQTIILKNGAFASFISDKTPVDLNVSTTAVTYNYQFFKLGAWV